jgi:hypothetical protein
VDGFETPKPTLARFLDAIAGILELTDGRLELIFRHGRLEAWALDGGVRPPAELGRFNGDADRLLAKTAVR